MESNETRHGIALDNVPQHVAVIMDGNGRWAQRQAERRLFGHQHAIEAVRQTVEAAVEMGVKYLTLYTFSTENWHRPQEEVEGLMALLVKAIEEETPTLMKNNVRLTSIGDIGRMPAVSLQKLQDCQQKTASNDGLCLVLALSYSARWEMGEAVKQMLSDHAAGRLSPEAVTEETLRHYLSTHSMPDPDLLIRTGGEHRISNFLLWQMAYTEFYFTSILWPDFRKEHFFAALQDFQKRQRRYGKTGEQVSQNPPTDTTAAKL